MMKYIMINILFYLRGVVMKDKVKKYILVFFLVYIFCFLYSFFISDIFNDEIWNYGFSYNIANGLVPYRDFNMIVTPLYSFLVAFFIRIFGGYLWSIHLFNGVVLTAIIYFSYRKIGIKSLILIPFIFLNCYPGYNIFSLLVILVLLNLVDKEFKYKDYILGLLVGVMFLTKQSIGFCLVIPLMYYANNKLKGMIGFISLIIIFLVYLMLNSALYEFIDYCFLGMFNFGDSNKLFLFLGVEVIVCLWLMYKLFKSKFRDRKIFYILMYQIVTVPIFDDYHFIIGFIPVMYYVLSSINIKKYKIKYYIIISFFSVCCWNFLIRDFKEINLWNDKDSYLYGRKIPAYVDLEEITNYIIDNSNSYNHIYFFSKNAYFVKLNAKYQLDKFDLINNGNMGYKGSKMYIEEIRDYCSNKTCMFILYKYEFDSATQTNKDIVNFVIDNYELHEEIHWFDIYTNNDRGVLDEK